MYLSLLFVGSGYDCSNTVILSNTLRLETHSIVVRNEASENFVGLQQSVQWINEKIESCSITLICLTAKQTNHHCEQSSVIERVVQTRRLLAQTLTVPKKYSSFSES